MKNTSKALLFTMELFGMECQAQTVSGNIKGHEYVDLGLPSGTKWATCNVGANKPTDFGNLFAWGETIPKKQYSWENYKWCENKSLSEDFIPIDFTKYCDSAPWGIEDNKTELDAADDAATANWGSEWRMPTPKEQQELLDGCNWEWLEGIDSNGIAGWIGTSIYNKNIIFLPAAGGQFITELLETFTIEGGHYWASSKEDFGAIDAYIITFDAKSINRSSSERYMGFSVRAVVK